MIVNGDMKGVEIVMTIFYNIAQKIITERETSLKIEQSNQNLLIHEPKQSKIRSSSSRTIYQTNTYVTHTSTHHTQENIGELGVILDRVNTLEGRMRPEYVLPADNEFDGGRRLPDSDNKSDSGIRKTRAPTSRSRPTSAPLGGRRKNDQDSKINQLAYSDLDSEGEVGDEDQAFQEAEAKKKRKLKKKKKKKSQKIHRDETNPEEDVQKPPEKHSSVQVRMTRRTQSMPSPTRPTSAPHHRQNSNDYDGQKRPTSPPRNGSTLNGFFTYDLRTGHRISKAEADQLLEESKQRYISLGIAVTDDGELRAIDTDMPITIHDLKNIRDKQKSLEHKNYQPKPLAPTISEYPGRRTEQSVEQFLEKMNRLRNPQQSGYQQSGYQRSGNQTVEGVAVPPPSKQQFFSFYQTLENMDMVLSIEHCHDCEAHPMTLRHQSAEYVTHANEILKYSASLIHSLRLCVRFGVVLAPTKISRKHSSRRIGAFEVQIAYRNEHGVLNVELLYSKLNTRRWPSKTVIEKRLTSTIAQYDIQTLPEETTNESEAKDLPSGAGTWTQVPMSEPTWSYVRPSKKMEDKEEKEISPIQWCFTSQIYAFFPNFSVGSKVKIHHFPNASGGIECYSSLATVINVFKDPVTHENMVSVLPQYSEAPIDIKEELCIGLNDPDLFEAPALSEFTNSIPLILYRIADYGIDNDLIRWRVQSEDDEILPAKNSQPEQLLLSHASFYRQINDLVWQGIRASPGEKGDKMLLPNSMIEADVQLAYSQPVINYMADLFGGRKINMTKWLKNVRPNFSLFTPSNLKPQESPKSDLPKAPLTIPSDQNAKGNPSMEKDIPQPNLVQTVSPAREKMIKSPDKDNENHLGLSFVLVEVCYNNLTSNQNLILEVRYQNQLQSCPTQITPSNGPNGKRVVSEIDWSPIIFRRKDISNTNGVVNVVVKHKGSTLGESEFSLAEVLQSALNDTQLITIPINTSSELHLDILLHCCVREVKSPVTHIKNKILPTQSLDRSLSHDFPEELNLYPDDYETQDDPFDEDVLPMPSIDETKKIESAFPPTRHLTDMYGFRLCHIRAQNIPSVEVMGLNDLFCVFKYGNHWSFQTSVKEDYGSEASWEFQPDNKDVYFVSDGETIASTFLQIEIYDHNKLRVHTLIGQSLVSMKTILESSDGSSHCRLESKDSRLNAGSIFLQFQIEKNPKINPIFASDNCNSLSFDSLKFNLSVVDTKKVSMYAVLAFDNWKRNTDVETRINGGCQWINFGSLENFSPQILGQKSLTIQLYIQKRQKSEGNQEEIKDTPFAVAHFNLTQLLTSISPTNTIPADTFDDNGGQNGRLLLTTTLQSAQDHCDDKSLLLQLFERTGGNSTWIDTAFWSAESELSDWLNIDLDTSYSHVTGIRLGANGLSGSIPPQICQLKYLTNLELQGNNLQGQIPLEIGNLTSLRVLSLNNNKLTGQIPETIRRCTYLEEVDLGNNSLVGIIPEALALPQLVTLNLLRNKFDQTTPIPLAFLNCKMLTSFLCDFIPYQESESFYKVFDWISSENDSFSRVVEGENAQQNLALVTENLHQLSREMLTSGTCFDDWQERPLSKWRGVRVNKKNQLMSLVLSNDSLCGYIPNCINTLQTIIFLDLSNNSIEGRIPEEIYQLTSIKYLYLNDNTLDGEIAAGISQMKELQTLNLSNNQLNGDLSQLQLPQTIRKLNLSQNQFEGILTAEFLRFHLLKELNLSGNNFLGDLPALNGIPLVEVLNLSKNQFGGPLPESLCELTSLRVLDVSFTNLLGKLPKNIEKLGQLGEVNLQMTRLEIDQLDSTKAKLMLQKKLPSLSKISL